MLARTVLSLPVVLALAVPASAQAELRLPSCQDLQELALNLPYHEVLAPNVMSRQRVPAALFDRRIDERFGKFALRWTEADFERVIQHTLNCRLAIRATTPDGQRRQQALDDLRQAVTQTSWYMRTRDRELQEFRANITSFANASPPDIFRIILLSHLAGVNDQARWFHAIDELVGNVDNAVRTGRYSHHHEFRHVVRPLSQNIAAADFPDVARLAHELLDSHIARFLRALNEGSQVPFVNPGSLRSLRDLDAQVDRMLSSSGATDVVRRLRDGIGALIVMRENEIVSHVERRLDALPRSWRMAASLRQPPGVQPSMASVRWPEGLARPEDMSSLSNDAWARLARSFDQRGRGMTIELADQVSSRINQASTPQELLVTMNGADTPEVPEDLRARFLSEARARLDAVLPRELDRVRARIASLPETEAGLRELDEILREARAVTRGVAWTQPWLDAITPILAARREEISRAVQQAHAALARRAEEVVAERIRTAETARDLIDIASWNPGVLGQEVASAQRFLRPGSFDAQLRARLDAVMERSVRQAREQFASYPASREGLEDIERELRALRQEWRSMAWLEPFAARVEALAQERIGEIRERIMRAEAGPLSGRVYRNQDLSIEFIDDRRAILVRNLLGMFRSEEVIDYELLGNDRIIFRIDGRNVIGRRDMDVIRIQDQDLRREMPGSTPGAARR